MQETGSIVSAGADRSATRKSKKSLDIWILIALYGRESQNSVIVIMATNRPDTINHFLEETIIKDYMRVF